MVVGPSNCGKIFFLRPLTKIFRSFSSPATCTFAWVGAESSELIFLNDFRWSEKVIPWHDFLNLLEGEAIHLAVPTTHYAEDILWSEDQPIFCTAGQEITKFEGQKIDEIETEMMKNRWTVFKFKQRIENVKEIES